MRNVKLNETASRVATPISYCIHPATAPHEHGFLASSVRWNIECSSIGMRILLSILLIPICNYPANQAAHNIWHPSFEDEQTNCYY